MPEKTFLQQQKALAQNYSKKIQALPDAFLECRDLRHSWQLASGFIPTKVKNEYIRRTICSRCSTERTEYFEFTRIRGLDKVAVSYSYLDGYLVPGFSSLREQSRYIRTEVFNRYQEK